MIIFSTTSPSSAVLHKEEAVRVFCVSLCLFVGAGRGFDLDLDLDLVLGLAISRVLVFGIVRCLVWPCS